MQTRHNRFLLLSVLVLNVMPLSLGAQSQAEQALSTLQKADEAQPFQAKVSVGTLGEEGERHEFLLRAHEGKEILVYQAPAREKGKVILQIEGRYWMHFPKISRTMILSPVGTLAGSVSNGDLLQPPLLTLYRLEQQEESEEGVVLKLLAKNPDAPYGQIEARFQDGKMLKAQFFTRSGILVKSAQYSQHFFLPWGAWIPQKAEISSPLNQEKTSVIELSDMKIQASPLAWFNPNNLGRVR
ncbi:MAG: outer membrane lipoprotein-sorting protein [Spirochaetales bacterium]|nr:outer membrane lipoprotein-sorting protein [Spirochaetales bacterium]